MMLKNMKLWSMSQKLQNKSMKMYNGNVKKCISVMHWNLGSRHWDSKRDDIQLLADQMSPDYLYISEANLFHDTPPHLTDIERYKLIKAKTMSKLKFSGIVLLVKEGMIFSVEHNRMEDEFSSIWIKVGGRGRSKLLIGGVYRDHYFIRQEGHNDTRDPVRQEQMWTRFINQWVDASHQGEVLVIGDTNVDTLKWDNPDPGMENMMDLLRNEIVTRNFSQVVQGPTRFWPGTRPSLIDHIWCNNVRKTSNVKNSTRGTVDHNMVSVTYRLKGNVTNNLETIGCDRRSLSESEFKRLIALQDWSDIFEEYNVDVAVHMFEDKFHSVLEKLAPMRKYQSRGKRSDWVSNNTKTLMTARDKMRDRAVQTGSQEDWGEYRRLRNLCNKCVKTDRGQNLKNHFERLLANMDTRRIYNLAKKKMGWKKMGSPEVFLVNGEKVTNPKKMAEIQIDTFYNKVKKLIDKLPPQVNDPLKYLKRALSRWGGGLITFSN